MEVAEGEPISDTLCRDWQAPAPQAAGLLVPDDQPDRFLCRIPVRFARSTVYCCGACTWTRTYRRDDAEAAQIEFDAHRCEDFPRHSSPPPIED